jgi:hypothetical protein
MWACIALMAGDPTKLPTICQHKPIIIILGTINLYRRTGGGDRIRVANSLQKKHSTGRRVLLDEPKAIDVKVAVFRATGYFEWGNQTPAASILVVIPRGMVKWDRTKASQTPGWGTDWIVEGV